MPEASSQLCRHGRERVVGPDLVVAVGAHDDDRLVEQASCRKSKKSQRGLVGPLQVVEPSSGSNVMTSATDGSG
jgi:hypothetical protein